MKRILAFIFAVVTALTCFGGTVFAEGAVYYGEISSLQALYDEHTEKVEYYLTFEGALAEGGTFVAEVYCSVLDPVYMTWKDEQNILSYRLDFDDVTVDGNTLVGELPLSMDNYGSHAHKDFRLRITGDSVSAETEGFYSLDSEDVPISPKGEPVGTPIGFDARALPSETAKGGYVIYSLSIKDIEKELSGGLSSLSMTVNFDSELLRLEGLDYEAAAGGWSVGIVNNQEGRLTLSMTGEGIKGDGSFVIKLRFLTLEPGICQPTLSGLSWGDSYGHSFTHEGFELGASITVSGEASLLGDVNHDGFVDNLDAAWVLRYDAGILFTVTRGDVNSDGNTDSLDAARILKYDAGLINGF